MAKVSKRQRLDEANSLTDRRSRHKVEAQENDIVRYRKMSVQGIQRRRSSVWRVCCEHKGQAVFGERAGERLLLIKLNHNQN